MIKKGDSIDEDRLVGLVSWGRECAQEGSPGVYARISFFYDWIVETVCDNFPEDSPPYMECTTLSPPTNPTTDSPTIKPTLRPTRTPVSTLSQFPTEALGNITDDDALWNITGDDALWNITDDDIDDNLGSLEELASLEEAVFLSSMSGLQECEGDCDNDDECEGDLVCFKCDECITISPGCIGYENIGKHVDVCVKPNFLPQEQTRTGPASSSSSLDSIFFLIPCFLHSIYGILRFVII